MKNIVAFLLLVCAWNVPLYGQNAMADSTYNATMNEAMKNVIASNVPSAIFYLKKAAELRPDVPATYYELSKMYDKMADGTQVVYYAKKAYNLDPKNLWYEEFLLSSAIKYQKYDAAIAVQQMRYNRNNDCLSDLMDMYFLTSAWDKTIATLDSYEKKHGVSENTMQYRLRAQIEQKDFKNALKLVNSLLKKQPDNTAFARQKLLVMHSMGKADEGWKFFSEYYYAHPNDGAAAYTMMTYYNEHQSYDALLGCLDVVAGDTSIAPKSRIQILESVAPLIAQDTVYIAPFEKALFNFAKNAQRDYSEAYAYVGEYFFAKGDAVRSKEYLRKALHSGLTDVPKILKLLYLESLTKDFQNMYTDATLAIKSGVEDADVYIQLGFVAYQIEKIKEGIVAMEKAKTLSKDASVSTYVQLCGMLATLYYQDGQYDKSDENSETALRLSVDDSTVLNNYAYYLSLRNKDLSRAKKMSERSLELEPNNVSFLDTYAYILYLQKDYQKALEYIEKAVAKSENVEKNILEHYRDILLALGKNEKAQMIEKMINKEQTDKKNDVSSQKE
ncbi:MAG: tetratricopeptide repeat protein [Flavobacteriales bacterium]|nr:tetratricopeptide repeat protein [Flavobacteriales bacterium]